MFPLGGTSGLLQLQMGLGFRTRSMVGVLCFSLIPICLGLLNLGRLARNIRRLGFVGVCRL